MMSTLIVVGSLSASIVTEVARDSVVDLDFTGNDLVYSSVGSFATLAILPNNIARPLAFGMTASGVLAAADDAGVV